MSTNKKISYVWVHTFQLDNQDSYLINAVYYSREKAIIGLANEFLLWKNIGTIKNFHEAMQFITENINKTRIKENDDSFVIEGQCIHQIHQIHQIHRWSVE